MMIEWRKDWIIGICNTNCDGVNIYRFFGTETEVKEKLLSLVNEDKENDPECWDFGTENIEDVHDELNGHEFYAFGSYEDYHIDYTAKEWPCVTYLRR